MDCISDDGQLDNHNIFGACLSHGVDIPSRICRLPHTLHACSSHH
jgi:hypothetical protein